MEISITFFKTETARIDKIIDTLQENNLGLNKMN